MERKGQISIWLAFRILGLEINFDNFALVICILYIDVVEICS